MSETIFNKNDYRILESLIERKCNAPAASLTIKQLINLTDMSQSKVRSVKNNFLLMHFIEEGSKDSNNKTFFYTEKGLNHFKSVFAFNDDDIKEMMVNFEKSLSKIEEE